MNQLQTVDAAILNAPDIASLFTALTPLLIDSKADMLTVELPWIGKQTVERNRALSLLIECAAKLGAPGTNKLMSSVIPRQPNEPIRDPFAHREKPKESKKRKREVISSSSESASEESDDDDDSSSEISTRHLQRQLLPNGIVNGRAPTETLSDLLQAGLIRAGDVISLRSHTATVDDDGYIGVKGTALYTNSPSVWYSYCCRHIEGKRSRIGAWNARVKRGDRSYRLKVLLEQYREMQ